MACLDAMCLDAEMLLGFVEGRLDGDALTATDAHLATCGDCREVVALLAKGTAPPRAVVDATTGDKVGRYELREQLGRGAMGVVHAAWDPELDRKIAIKLLRPDLGDRASTVARTRLVQEGRAIAQLAHPNVVAVHDVGEFPGGVFVAMELVDGSALSSWATGRTADEIIAAVEQAARGIAAAHRAGIVHRDVKPANLLVGKDGRVRVVDFGLAQRPDGEALVEPAALDDVAVTATGVIVGTPLYMAPETMAGAEADARADQYGLAASLYEALAGTRPFAARTLAGLEREKRHRLLAKPQRRIAPRVLAAIERGLDPAPEARWPSLDAFADRLASHLHRRRRHVLYAFAATGVVAIGTTIAIATRTPAAADRCGHGAEQLAEVWSPARARLVGGAVGERVATRFERYGTEWVAGYRRVCEATHVRGEQSEALLDVRMRCLDARRHQMAALATVLETRTDDTTRQNAVAAVEQLSPIADCDRTEALATIVQPPPHVAQAVAAAERVVDEAEALERAGHYPDALAKLAAIDPKPLDARALEARIGLVRGELQHELGQYPEAEATLFAAARAAADARDDLAAARAWTLLVGVVGYLEGRPGDGLVIAKMAEAAVARAGAADSVGAELDSMLGLVLDASGKLVDARAHHERALAARERTLGKDHLEVAQVLDNLGAIPLQQQRYDEAEQIYTRALAIRRAALGDDHPDVAASWTALGSAQRGRGAFDAAKQSYERAYTIWKRVLGDSHPSVAAALNNLAMLERDMQKPGDAEQHLEAAIAIWRAGDAKASAADIATAIGNLGLIAYDRGDLTRAAAKIAESIAVLEATLGTDHPRLANQLANLARIHLERKAPAEAEPLFRRALAITEAATSKDDAALAGPLLGIAQCRIARKDPAGALALLERIRALHGEVDAHDRAVAAFTLAKLSWDAGKDRARARTLAEEAKTDPAIASAVTAWLAQHR
ncbi:MAG TPA: serine/threonine-protein kinase [Kofleriaceae bacterium]|nr:serine/threonine-protein kinase [Kofleriaceae bacterium]